MPKITSADLLVTQNFPSADATDNSLIVTIDPAKPLPLGTYVFQLVVEDAAGNVSVPTRFKMQVVDTTAPNAIIDGLDRIPFRTAFTLSGQRSFDPDEGKIVKYAWTRIAQAMHFEVNQTVSGNFPTIEVDGDLPVGRRQFQLVVEDAQGQVSAPTIFTFTIFQPPIIVGPTPIVIDPIGPGPRPVGPVPIGPGIREAQPPGAARRPKTKTPKKK